MKPQDPLNVDQVPPNSVLNLSMDALQHTLNKKGSKGNKEYVIEFPGYGCFTLESLRILSRYDKIQSVGREVSEDIRWLPLALKERSPTDRQMVTEALLDWWNMSCQCLVELKGYQITSQDLSHLCCERYLSDEIINLL